MHINCENKNAMGCTWLTQTTMYQQSTKVVYEKAIISHI